MNALSAHSDLFQTFIFNSTTKSAKDFQHFSHLSKNSASEKNT